MVEDVLCSMNAVAPGRTLFALRCHVAFLLAALAGWLGGSTAALADPAAELFWPQWRGPLSTVRRLTRTRR